MGGALRDLQKGYRDVLGLGIRVYGLEFGVSVTAWANKEKCR